MNPPQIVSLRECITREIREKGSIDVASFIAHALYHPQQGYYATHNPIGPQGDFITAPEMTQVFGEILGAQIAYHAVSTGMTGPIQLIELGPGHGTLMYDVLSVLCKIEPLFSNIQVHLVEISQTLQEKQREKLSPFLAHITWHSHIEEVPHLGSTYVLANEFFDALPIEQHTQDGKRQIILNEANEFDWEPGVVMREFCPFYEPFMYDICQRIEARGGQAIIIDYGYDENVPQGDTLQALRQHRYANILTSPGQVDISHHVHFGFLKCLVPATLDVQLEDMGIFLMERGLEERTQQLCAHASTQTCAQLLSAAVRIKEHQHMGTLFKVLTVSSTQ